MEKELPVGSDLLIRKYTKLFQRTFETGQDNIVKGNERLT